MTIQVVVYEEWTICSKKWASIHKMQKFTWYIQWVGTAEQAQRRIDRFKESQQEMYDNGDELLRHCKLLRYVNPVEC